MRAMLKMLYVAYVSLVYVPGKMRTIRRGAKYASKNRDSDNVVRAARSIAKKTVAFQ